MESPLPNLMHIRFKPAIKEFAVAWITKKSEKFIISEEIGVKDEGLHYHACFMTSLTDSAIRKAFCDASKKLNIPVAKGKGNGVYGSTKPCTSEAYVCKGGKIVSSKGYEATQIEELIKEGAVKFAHKLSTPIVATSIPTERVIVVRKARLTITERLCLHAETELKWKRDAHWTLEHYEANICQRECAKHMTQYLRAKFNDPQAVVYLRNLMYEFADDDLKEYLEKRFTSNALNSV